MTALNYFQVRGRGVLIMDTASIDQDGIVRSLDPKGMLIPEWKGFIASTGSVSTIGEIMRMVVSRFDGIDDLCENSEINFRAAREIMIEDCPEEFAGPWGVLISAWSEQKEKTRAVWFSSNLDVYFEADFDKWFSPCPDDAGLDAFFDGIRQTGGLDSFNAATHGLALIAGQRAKRLSSGGDGFGANCHAIGGSVQVTEIGQDGVSQRVIHRWDEDSLGERIDPARSAGVVVPMIRLSRHERRRREKLGRRAVA